MKRPTPGKATALEQSQSDFAVATPVSGSIVPSSPTTAPFVPGVEVERQPDTVRSRAPQPPFHEIRSTESCTTLSPPFANRARQRSEPPRVVAHAQPSSGQPQQAPRCLRTESVLAIGDADVRRPILNDEPAGIFTMCIIIPRTSFEPGRNPETLNQVHDCRICYCGNLCIEDLDDSLGNIERRQQAWADPCYGCNGLMAG